MDLDLAGLSVMLVIPVNRDFPFQTTMSLLSTQALMHHHGIPCGIKLCPGQPYAQYARSMLVNEFLKSEHNRMFWIDSDMAWDADSFLRLLALSTKMDVVAAAYVSKKDKPTFMVSMYSKEVTYNEFGCVKVKGLGLGFAVVTREVIEKLAAKAPKLKSSDDPVEPAPHVFRIDDEEGWFRGEDMAFFSDIRDLGYDVWVDPTIPLGHVGPKVFQARLADHIRANSDGI